MRSLICGACYSFTLGVLLLFGLMAALPLAASAKSPPDRITITSPTLTAPVEIAEASVLAGFSPWGRGFIDWDRGVASAPPTQQPAYDVSFYLEARESVPIYVLHYVPNASSAGYIYIPGHGAPWHRLNSGTISGASSSDRWNPEGRWQYASGDWDALMRTALEHAGAAPQPAEPASDVQRMGVAVSMPSVAAVILFATLGSAAVVRWRIAGTR